MRAGLLGRKLGHSLSPQIHRFFGDCEYRLYERKPADVSGFLHEAFAYGGLDFLNVTIPSSRQSSGCATNYRDCKRWATSISSAHCRRRLAATTRCLGVNGCRFDGGCFWTNCAVLGRCAAMLQAV